MANTFYISAGLPVKKTTGAATANTVYISAGLQPAVEAGGDQSVLPIIMQMQNHFNGGSLDGPTY